MFVVAFSSIASGRLRNANQPLAGRAAISEQSPAHTRLDLSKKQWPHVSSPLPREWRHARNVEHS